MNDSKFKFSSVVNVFAFWFINKNSGESIVTKIYIEL